MYSMSDKIRDLENQIRNYINKTRVKHVLIQDSKKWNQLCSSLDVIDDTGLAITSYLSSEWPNDTGLQYIYIYGLLQAMFLQQDAVTHMSESLGIDCPKNDELEKIRNIRSDSIGHPTNRSYGKSYHFIGRGSMRKASFAYMSTFPDSGLEFNTIDVFDISEKQLKAVTSLLEKVVSILEKREMVHKEKFSDEKLVNLLPQAMSYEFQSVIDGILTPSKRKNGAICLKLIRDLYKKLIQKLKKRGEYPVLAYNINEILYPIEKLEAFFEDREENTMSEKDAYIFASFLSNKHTDILKLLEEIDQEYEKVVDKSIINSD
jgi:hypothetical protein